MKLTNLYRISDGSYRKDRLRDKWHCLNNFLTVFDPDETIIFADNVKDETYEILMQKSRGAGVKRTNSEGNADSFNIVYNYALEHAPAGSYVYASARKYTVSPGGGSHPDNTGPSISPP